MLILDQERERGRRLSPSVPLEFFTTADLTSAGLFRVESSDSGFSATSLNFAAFMITEHGVPASVAR